MMKNYENNVNEYSMDYRNSSSNRTITKEKRQTQKVVGSVRNNKPLIYDKDHQDNRINKDTEEYEGTLKTKKIKKRKVILYRLTFGCIILFLSLVGVIIVTSTFNRTASVVSNSDLDKYSSFIAPVVMHDPVPFDSIENADKQMVISSSIWRTILQNGVDNYNSFDDAGMVLIPVEDINKSCGELFGPNCKINTQEEIFGPFFSFSKGEENFHIGAISNLGTYIPRVENIKEEGDLVVLKVAYLSRDEKNIESPEKHSEPNKFMTYKLKLNEETDKLYIYSIEDT